MSLATKIVLTYITRVYGWMSVVSESHAGVRSFLSDMYLLIYSTKQMVCLKSYYMLGTAGDMDRQKISCLGAVYSVFCRNDAYTPINKTR